MNVPQPVITITTNARDFSALLELATRAPKSTAAAIWLETIGASAQAQAVAQQEEINKSQAQAAK